MIKKIAFVLISVAIKLVTYGQTWQEGFIPSNRLDTANAIVGNGSWGINVLSKSEPFLGKDKFDTIKILMLICDTSWMPDEVFEWGTKKSFNIWNAYSMFGYEVTITEFIPAHLEGYYYIHGGNEIKHIRWLDGNKKPLSKNTIVWLTQKINQ